MKFDYDNDQIQEIVVLDIMKVIFGGRKGYDNKVVFVNPAQKSQHLTFKITDKAVDFHKTLEPTMDIPQKRYESLSRFNLDMESLRAHLNRYQDASISEIVRLIWNERD